MNLSREEKMILIAVLGNQSETSFTGLVAKYAKVDNSLQEVLNALYVGFNVSRFVYGKVYYDNFELKNSEWKVMLIVLYETIKEEEVSLALLESHGTNSIRRPDFVKLSKRVKTEPEIVENLLNSLENKFGKVGEYGS